MSVEVGWLALPIGIPLTGALIAAVSGRGGVGRGVAALAGLFVLEVSLDLAAHVLRYGPQTVTVGGWPAGLGIALVADGPGLLLLAASALVGTLVSLHAMGTARTEEESPAERHFPTLWLLAWTGLNVVFLSGDLFNLYVGLELLGLSAVALIALGGAEAVRAAARYLLVSVVASFAWLLGVALLYAQTGALDLATVGATLTNLPSARVAFALMFGAMLFKTAVFPLHFWLPAAHASAPARVSALLSAVVVKATFLVALRLWLQVFAALPDRGAGVALGVLGAIAVVWGAAQALRQERLKRIVAWSTVAQIGYLFLAFPLLRTAAGEVALTGVLLFAVAHALAKAAMFLAAGAIRGAAGTDRLSELGGLARRLPLSVFTFGIAGVTLMGLPPSAGFVGKWSLLDAALVAEAWWIVVVLLVGGLLAAAYVFRVLEVMIRSPEATTPLRGPGRGAEWAALALALGAVVLGPLARLPLLLAASVGGGAP